MMSVFTFPQCSEIKVWCCFLSTPRHPPIAAATFKAVGDKKISLRGGKISISRIRTQTVILSPRCQACRRFKNRLKCCSDERICISLVAPRELTPPYEYWLLLSYKQLSGSARPLQNVTFIPQPGPSAEWGHTEILTSRWSWFTEQ